MTQPKPLSPAAQAVLDAFAASEGGVYLEGDPERLAAAFRAAGKHMHGLYMPSDLDRNLSVRIPGIIAAERQLQAIAAELEEINYA